MRRLSVKAKINSGGSEAGGYETIKNVISMLPLITLSAYLAAVLIGYLYALMYYSVIFPGYAVFMELAQYLQLPIQQPKLFISFLLLVVAIVCLTVSLTLMSKRNINSLGKQSRGRIRAVLFTLCFAIAPILIFIYAVSNDLNKQKIIAYANGAPELHVISRDGDERCVAVLGIVGDYYVFWDKDYQKGALIPRSSVKEIISAGVYRPTAQSIVRDALINKIQPVRGAVSHCGNR